MKKHENLRQSRGAATTSKPGSKFINQTAMRTRNNCSRSEAYCDVHHTVSIPDGWHCRRVSASGGRRRRCVLALAKKNSIFWSMRSITCRRACACSMPPGASSLRNRQYLRMYQLSADVVKPGCTLRELIEHRKRTGLFTGDPEQYCKEIIDSVANGKPSQWVVAASDGRIDSRHQRADAERRLGLDPRGRHRTATAAAAARRHGRAAEASRHRRCGDRGVSFRDGSAARAPSARARLR